VTEPLTFAGEVWIAPGDGVWHFTTVPPEIAEIIHLASGPRVGFGSVRVRVTVGDSSWSTSVFPNTRDTYVLPLKRSVRDAEGILAGDVVDVLLTLA
jgi:Domain of unknown function (DUF1905)